MPATKPKPKTKTKPAPAAPKPTPKPAAKPAPAPSGKPRKRTTQGWGKLSVPNATYALLARLAADETRRTGTRTTWHAVARRLLADGDKAAGVSE